MKRAFSVICVFAMLMCLISAPAAAEEAAKIEQNGFVCERMRDGGLKLVGFTGDAEGRTVNIPSTIEGSHVECIGAYAFDGCKMKSVTIPETVRVIETFAFNDCAGIQKITIPNEVTFIEGNPFTGCRNLVNISLDPKHPTLQVTSDGVLYSKKNRMLLCYPCSKTERTFAVMNGTLSIGDNAFLGCDKLGSISLPDTLTDIGESAFLGCVELTGITLPGSLLSIGELAFAGCVSLTGVSLPKQISRLETGTFYNCADLTNVAFPERLTDICDRAFAGCTSLKEIHLPDSVVRIGDGAFFGCASLTDAYIPVSVTRIGIGACDDCSVRLYMHLEEFAYAEIYARLYDISFTYGNEDSFLTTQPEPQP